MGTITAGAVFAAQGTAVSNDSEVFAYAVAGVVLLVVGSVLTLLANARRVARAERPAPARRHVRTSHATSPSVTRLQHDVQRWLRSG
jgi:hypothetical protein